MSAKWSLHLWQAAARLLIEYENICATIRCACHNSSCTLLTRLDPKKRRNDIVPRLQQMKSLSRPGNAASVAWQTGSVACNTHTVCCLSIQFTGLVGAKTESELRSLPGCLAYLFCSPVLYCTLSIRRVWRVTSADVDVDVDGQTNDLSREQQ